MIAEFEKRLSQTLEEIKSQGLFKTERIITSPQDAHIAIAGGKRVLNMCANNYLGLADHPALITAAKEALETHGFGMASVRFILFRRQRRAFRNAAHRKRRGDQ